MEDLIPEIATKKTKVQRKQPNWHYLYKLILGLLFCLIIFAALKYEDVVDENPDGTIKLKPDREAKLKDYYRRIKKCTQYALIASENGWYACHNCPNGQDSIYLYIGEVWKYGHSCEKNIISDRYKNVPPDTRLDVDMQFFGTLEECKAEEMRKIFNYPLLPENQKRKRQERLARPAGNPYDA